jgi:transposase
LQNKNIPTVRIGYNETPNLKSHKRRWFIMALTMGERIMIEQLKVEGCSIRKISRELGMSRITVKRYLENPGKKKYCRKEPYKTKLDPFKGHIKNRLKDYPNITSEKLYREIMEQGFNGSYRTVTYYLKKIRPIKEQEAFLRYETQPAEEAQVDWAEFGRINYYGRDCKLYCFSFVWGYSRRQYVEFTLRQDLYTLMRCHKAAFEYFGGIPKRILYDNMLQVVKVNDGERIEYNEKFMDFALYHGFLPDACDVRQPHQKGKIERVIEYIRTSFFTGEKFSFLDELNSKAINWCKEIADKRIHGTTHEKPIDRWEIEKTAISPLPQTDYDTRKVEHRLVQKDCYLNWENNCYSVPWQYVKKTVLVKANELMIHIYYDDKCIAEHPICKMKGKYIRNPQHLKGIPHIKDSRKEKYREELSDFGEVGIRYLDEVLKASTINPYYHLSRVVKLKQSYPTSEIARAIEIALKFKALNSKTVINLVRKYIPPYSLNQLEQVVTGIDYSFQEVEQRPLAFYDWVAEGVTNG